MLKCMIGHPNANNRLLFTEFQELKEYVMDQNALDPSAYMRQLIGRANRSDQEIKELRSLPGPPVPHNLGILVSSSSRWNSSFFQLVGR